MSTTKTFPFERARRVTPKEVAAARNAIASKTGKERPLRGRPPKSPAEKYQMVSIRLHPKIVRWARQEARRRRVGYQTIINQRLMRGL